MSISRGKRGEWWRMPLLKGWRRCNLKLLDFVALCDKSGARARAAGGWRSGRGHDGVHRGTQQEVANSSASKTRGTSRSGTKLDLP